ncbi:hypothetical protein [Rhodopirellula bahusiensis]|nr:hypothetical protein [Rhodopirellula bahusiensis]
MNTEQTPHEKQPTPCCSPLAITELRTVNQSQPTTNDNSKPWFSGGGIWLGALSGTGAIVGGITCCGFPLLSGLLASVGIGSGVPLRD